MVSSPVDRLSLAILLGLAVVIVPAIGCRNAAQQHAGPSIAVTPCEPHEPSSILEYDLQAGDTLDSVAEKRYGHRSYYRIIKLYNHIEDERRIEPGTRVKTPELRSVLSEENAHGEMMPEIDRVLCARSKFVMVEKRLQDLRIEAGRAQLVLPDDIRQLLIEAADELEKATAGFEKPVVVGSTRPSSTIGQLRAVSSNLRQLSRGSNDGYGYDLDLVHQQLGLALAYEILWARAGFD